MNTFGAQMPRFCAPFILGNASISFLTRFIPYCLLLLLPAGCGFLNDSKDDQEALARVYDKYLYKSELTGVGAGAATPEDSIQAVRSYIESWVRHNLMLRYAQDNLPEEEQRLNDRLRDYKESLLIYAYENELVSEKLDTTVSRAEIEKYYNENREIFLLKRDIVKLKYVVVPLSASVKLDSVRVWLKKPNDFNRPKLTGFCRDNATRFMISDTVWYNKEDLASFLPVQRFNLASALSSKSYLEVSDSGYAYLMKFDDYHAKGEDAPQDFVADEIVAILINQRKIDFISRIHKSIYDDALKNGEFEVFLDEGIKPGNNTSGPGTK